MSETKNWINSIIHMAFVNRFKWNVSTGRCFNCILTWKYYRWSENEESEVYMKWSCRTVMYLPDLNGRWFAQPVFLIRQVVDVTIGFLSINQWMSQAASYPSTIGCHNRLLIHQSTSGCHNQLLIHQPVDVIIGNEWKLTNQHVVSLYWTGCVHNHEEVHMC
jgi:hypothetical protein